MTKSGLWCSQIIGKQQQQQQMRQQHKTVKPVMFDKLLSEIEFTWFGMEKLSKLSDKRLKSLIISSQIFIINNASFCSIDDRTLPATLQHKIIPALLSYSASVLFLLTLMQKKLKRKFEI